MRSKKIVVQDDLYSRLKAKAKTDGYASVDELVQHVLSTILSEDAQEAVSDNELEHRLRGLGYLG